MYKHIACSSVHLWASNNLPYNAHGKHIVSNVLEWMKFSCNVRKSGMRAASAAMCCPRLSNGT